MKGYSLLEETYEAVNNTKECNYCRLCGKGTFLHLIPNLSEICLRILSEGGL